MSTPSIAFIGGGNMARSLIGARLRGGAPADTIRVAEPDAGLRERLVADFGVAVFERGVEAAAGADIIVLAVKPQVLREVCRELAAVVQTAKPLVISIAAGIRIAQIDAWLGGGLAIVRTMPNTPALIGAGATGLHANPATGTDARAEAEAILASAGATAWIDDEALMDVVTALSGSGPAYFFLLIEALEDAAVAAGLPRDIARRLTVQTGVGATRMAAEDGEPPGRLRERVTSPGGTTQAALDAFAAGGLRDLVASAIGAAIRRGRELSDRFDAEGA
ncbi:MAG TPA: pyrroline-5-carboxylate reductase [Dokdonella sp.]|uniref:pyrroline-5-carboxylate reductase n=1 Tax=Dokdonella sp. TaxID=2291710 RepID=UPI0025C4D984|nr:pyrroline-5-carboxylate reductase [Dokdonella sp.]MBX3690880.1 pyrroline-5-carboxylate reductase [Dokdonella sp.]HNR91396.1 pyrroline-5-carboxylate reductase [Dokdonella sp.]